MSIIPQLHKYLTLEMQCNCVTKVGRFLALFTVWPRGGWVVRIEYDTHFSMCCTYFILYRTQMFGIRKQWMEWGKMGGEVYKKDEKKNTTNPVPGRTVSSVTCRSFIPVCVMVPSIQQANPPSPSWAKRGGGGREAGKGKGVGHYSPVWPKRAQHRREQRLKTDITA